MIPHCESIDQHTTVLVDTVSHVNPFVFMWIIIIVQVKRLKWTVNHMMASTFRDCTIVFKNSCFSYFDRFILSFWNVNLSAVGHECHILNFIYDMLM